MIRPKAVLFDLGDTIVGNQEFDPIAGNTRLLEFIDDAGSVGPEDIQALAQKLDGRLTPLRNASVLECPAASFNRLLFETLNLTSSLSAAEMAAEFWHSSVTFYPEPGIHDALDYMESRGIRRAIVSNAVFSGSVLEAELQKHGLLERFEFLMSSSDYGVRKPHPLIFETALAKLSLKSEEALFVGDKLETDIAGANGVGLCSVWYNRLGQEGSGTIPDYQVVSWPEFVELLERV